MFVASYARLPPGSRFHLKRQHLHVPWQRAIQGFCGYNQAKAVEARPRAAMTGRFRVASQLPATNVEASDVAMASGPPLHPHRLLAWEMKLDVQEAAE